ncbi:hypothetical protein EVAR_3729_1 [Eumeta japonica]|uniref:Uncharacterized protein n=1 Tax=Eumeta variegata TaxID=151549 RepID=A0A4C1SSB7_EUMVA|nr:hypothetical protein EVAR_3729_1 [Eumeta japonica]
MRVPLAHVSSITPQAPSNNPLPSSSATRSSIRRCIPTQEAANALVILPKSQMSVGSIYHLHAAAAATSKFLTRRSLPPLTASCPVHSRADKVSLSLFKKHVGCIRTRESRSTTTVTLKRQFLTVRLFDCYLSVLTVRCVSDFTSRWMRHAPAAAKLRLVGFPLRALYEGAPFSSGSIPVERQQDFASVKHTDWKRHVSVNVKTRRSLRAQRPSVNSARRSLSRLLPVTFILTGQCHLLIHFEPRVGSLHTDCTRVQTESSCLLPRRSDSYAYSTTTH